MALRITLGNLTVDRGRYTVWVGDTEVDLTYVEFELLHALASNASQVLSRQRLTAAIWRDPAGESQRVTVHISRLRRKLQGMSPWRIHTVTKRGYVLRQASDGAAGLKFQRGGSANVASVPQ